MGPKRFFRLVIWEFEEYWDFPVLELIIFSAVFSVLNQPITFTRFETRYQNLTLMMIIINFFLIFTVGAVFSRSFAGSLAKGETKRLLSYPAKRSSVLLSKFITNFLAVLAVYGIVFSLNIPLLALSPSEPMFHVSLMSLVVQLIFLCSVAMTLSLVIKSEVISVFAFILLLFGFETITYNERNLSFYARHNLVFTYFEELTLGRLPEVTFQEVILAVSFPILISAFLLALSLIYFNYVMEID